MTRPSEKEKWPKEPQRAPWRVHDDGQHLKNEQGEAKDGMTKNETVQTPDETTRYAIASAYLNDQTPESWELLRKRVMTPAEKAAPELMAALKEALTELEYYEGEGETTVKARAAILKATEGN